ncbi:hypothetical protein, partial [Phenylobacterium sp.]
MTKAPNPPAVVGALPDPQNAVSPVFAKAIRLAERHRRLQADQHQAEVELALTRSRLTLALDRALAGRAEAEAAARQAQVAIHRRAARRRPQRRNRLSQM